MDAKKIEKQLLDFAEKLSGEELVEALMEKAANTAQRIQHAYNL